MQLGKPKVR